MTSVAAKCDLETLPSFTEQKPPINRLSTYNPYKPYYYQSQDTQKESIIFSTDDGIYEYDISTDTYSILCELHTKAARAGLLHNLFNRNKGNLYRLGKDFSVMTYSVRQQKWIGYIDSDLPIVQSIAGCVSYPNTSIYLIKNSTNRSCAGGYQFTFNSRKFIKIHESHQIPISLGQERNVYRMEDSILHFVESLQKLVLITKEATKSKLEIYELTDTNKWVKMMDIETNGHDLYFRSSSCYYVACSVGYVLILFVTNYNCLCCVDLLAQKSWITHNFVSKILSIQHMMQTNDTNIHLFGHKSYWMRSSVHFKFRALDVMPTELKEAWMKKLELLVDGYSNIGENIDDWFIPNTLKQIIISYAYSMSTMTNIKH